MSEIFHQMANHYDTPERIQLAATIRSAVEKEFSAQTHDQKLIDYGGGTGLVTLPFASRFKEVIIIDSAAGMLAMADKKIKEAKQANVRTLELDATKDLPAEKADIILLSLVLLHIPETKVILKQLSQCFIQAENFISLTSIRTKRSSIQKSIMVLTTRS
ncbi:hypothetical protein EMQU_2356 [Enterococcus mundtii QU 25]|uniref:Methyltransferase type 11 domain-containing protein n=1 Tax=Enterococcus mundtii TaxID=53346 RepID=A0AAI8WD95_ENTMU|nr:hypothetical protein EMQU_2356 [Enterococcus mundtii QU 25]BBM14243.1 uncharacterized protein EM151A_1006 [Enterococcus mundtii]